jgi:hypothetical protein
MDVGGSKGGVKSDINVTPLVDVMLVLLIIMMLVAPMLQKGVDVKLPEAANTTDKPDTQGQTVVGVINAFAGIGSQGSAGLGAVSAGISEALIETALGLVVAIPAVWLYNYFTGRLEYFNVEMDNSSSELVDFFIKKTA